MVQEPHIMLSGWATSAQPLQTSGIESFLDGSRVQRTCPELVPEFSSSRLTHPERAGLTGPGTRAPLEGSRQLRARSSRLKTQLE